LYATIFAIEPPIEHRDVTTIMRLLADIQVDVRRIRNLLEDEDGEEEEDSEDDA
jgi:phage host-nuclease inhibitor protein Gam